MTQGWVNLGRSEADIRALEKHYRETGYSDGYGLGLARFTHPVYRQGYMAGRRARLAFEKGAA